MQEAVSRVSSLAVHNMEGLELVVQGEVVEKNPNLKTLWQSEGVQILEGGWQGYHIKNLPITQPNYDQLPDFISKMIEKNGHSFNFDKKIEVTRTRTGFTERGEKEVTNLATKSYLKYLAQELFNGNKDIRLQGLNEDLSTAYHRYAHYEDFAKEVFNPNKIIEIRDYKALDNESYIGLVF